MAKRSVVKEESRASLSPCSINEQQFHVDDDEAKEWGLSPNEHLEYIENEGGRYVSLSFNGRRVETHDHNESLPSLVARAKRALACL